MGYHRAGFDVVGVDIRPQRRFPFKFVQADAMTFDLGEFDFVHASPPCQAYSTLVTKTDQSWPKLIDPIREILKAWGGPYIIENVIGSPLRNPVLLCGTMFRGLRVIRHRLFESNLELHAPRHLPHPRTKTFDRRRAHFGLLDQNSSFVQVTGGGNCTVVNARDAMGITWMTKQELNAAIPPVYTEWLGRNVLRSVRYPVNA